MKKLICILVGLAVVFTANPFFSSTGTAKADDKLRYHLDIGVYVVNKQDGKWIKGGLGETVNYTLNPTFSKEIEVTRAMSLNEAQETGVWKWDTNGYTTSYNPKTKTAKRYYYDMYEDYRVAQQPEQSKFKINIAKGKTISISEDIKLQAYKGYDKTYNLVSQYNKYIKDMNDDISIVQSPEYQKLLTEYNRNKEDIQYVKHDLSQVEQGSDAYKEIQTTLLELSQKQKDLESRITFLSAQQVKDKTKIKVDLFLNEVYKFWGGSEGLKATNLSMWQMMQNMSQLKEIPSGTEYYLVFIPTVIEYRESYTQPPQVTPPSDTTGSCTDVIRWSEVKTHTYTVGKKTYTCNHVYTYETRLNATAKLKADRPNGNSTTFKSGYGFSVDMANTITTKQVSNAGSCGENLSKSNGKIPTPPTVAEVKNTWIVKLKDSKVIQPKTVALAKASSTATTANFVTAKNPLSPTKRAMIYTDVALKGTKKAPVKHTITVYSYGGGVNGVQFCKSIPLTFIINGNMYEDDWTVDRM